VGGQARLDEIETFPASSDPDSVRELADVAVQSPDQKSTNTSAPFRPSD
jgi:hypothetical protein